MWCLDGMHQLGCVTVVGRASHAPALDYSDQELRRKVHFDANLDPNDPKADATCELLMKGIAG
jgi:hypothetical protein